MRTKLIAAIVTLLSALGAAPPAHASPLRLATAQYTCAAQMTVYADGWFANNGYGHTIVRSWGPWYHRNADGSMIVHAVFRGQNAGQAEVRCYVVGSDENPGVAFVAGYPLWTFLGRENYPYNACSGRVYYSYCLHDPGFS